MAIGVAARIEIIAPISGISTRVRPPRRIRHSRVEGRVTPLRVNLCIEVVVSGVGTGAGIGSSTGIRHARGARVR
jgi:hypothetical protein